MALPSPKELKKLAAACRAAGITSFKGDGIEFTLEPLALKPPRVSAKTTSHAQVKDVSNDPIETEEPTPDDLLYWSVTSDEASQ